MTSRPKLLFMNTKALSRLLITLTTLFSFPLMAQEYQAFSVLGTSEAVCKPGIETREELQAFFANDSETVRAILADANWEGDPNLLFEAIAAGNFSERFYDKGTKFQWTGARKKSGPKALPYRVWAGEEPMKAFEANVVSGCEVHQIVIPHACCNVSLAATTKVEVPAPQIQIQSNNEDVKICADSGNEVVITDATGANRTVPLDADGCWTGKVAPGNMSAAVVNENECGVAAADVSHLVVASPPAPAAVAVAETPEPEAPGLIPFVAAFAGPETRMRYEPDWDKYYEDDADVFGVKAGLIKPLSDAWSLFGQIGYLDRDGVSDRLVYSDDTIFVDVGIDRNIGKGFVGAGVGYWNLADSEYDDVSLFLHGGVGLGSSNFQIYGEGRVFGDELDDIENNNLVTGGVRYLFK